MANELHFRTEEERQAYAMKLAIEHVGTLNPATIEKCGRDRLLHDYQQEFLAFIPPVNRVKDQL